MCGSGSVFRIRIRMQEAPEYGSNTDPDPQHCYEVYENKRCGDLGHELSMALTVVRK